MRVSEFRNESALQAGIARRVEGLLITGFEKYADSRNEKTARHLPELHSMESGSSKCSQVLEQIDASLRAIRLHLITYQLQLLRLSLRNPVKITDAANYRTEPATQKERTS
jgi:hypothetical protein